MATKKETALEILSEADFLFLFFQIVGQIFFFSMVKRPRKQGAPLLFDNREAPAESAVIPLHFRRGQMNLTDGCVTQTLD